jgi:hypothetical protein
MKERMGPGTRTVSAGGAVIPVVSAVGLADEDSDQAGVGERAHRLKIAAARVANVRRGNFIGGYLLRTF